MKVVFVHKNPSICMLYDYKTSLHSVWKIRRTNEEVKNLFIYFLKLFLFYLHLSSIIFFLFSKRKKK